MVIAFLEAEKFVVEHVTAAEDALLRLCSSKYDALIIDWNLPGQSGIEMLQEIRKEGGEIPCLFLTGRSEMKDRLQAFDSGADDYMSKPFDVKELLARLKALLRRPHQLLKVRLFVQDIALDTKTHQVLKGEIEVTLMPKEFELLLYLMKSPDQVFSVKELLSALWPHDSSASDHTFRQCVTRLRKKIDFDPEEPIIRNIHGVGYKIASQPLKKKIDSSGQDNPTI